MFTLDHHVGKCIFLFVISLIIYSNRPIFLTVQYLFVMSFMSLPCVNGDVLMSLCIILLSTK